MYTVIITIANDSMMSWACIYVETLEEAKAYKPAGINCEVVKCAVVDGKLSDDEAYDYLFD